MKARGDPKTKLELAYPTGPEISPLASHGLGVRRDPWGEEQSYQPGEWKGNGAQSNPRRGQEKEVTGEALAAEVAGEKPSGVLRNRRKPKHSPGLAEAIGRRPRLHTK